MIRRPVLLYAAATCIALVALLPMRTALALAGARLAPLSATAVEGTLWRAHLQGATWSGTPLGNVRLRVAPLALLRGAFELHATGRTLSADIRLAPGHGARNVDGLLSLHLPGLDGLDLDLEARDVALRFADGRCVAAGGTLQGLLSAVDASAGWPSVALAATPHCEDGDWVAAFADTDAAPGTPNRIQVRLALAADGRYHLATTVADADPATAQALRASGFALRDGQLVHLAEGRL